MDRHGKKMRSGVLKIIHLGAVRGHLRSRWLATKPRDLSLIHGICRVEGEKQLLNLSFDLYMHAKAQAGHINK